MIKNNIQLSIIIPVYNAEKYIKECLNSIIKEDIDENVEIILINDGSTDSSLDICKAFVEENSVIKLFNNTNHGVSYTRNFGIDKALGKWIMFIDADDILSEEWYSTVRECFNSNTDMVIFSCDDLQNISSKEVEYVIGLKKNNMYLSSPCSKLYKREVLKNNNIIFNQEIINGEDMLFNIEMFLSIKKYQLINKNIYKYRININSATKKFNDNFICSDRVFHSELKRILNTKNEKNKDISGIINYCKLTAIFSIAHRLSCSGKYSIFKKNSYIFNEYIKDISDLAIIKNKKKRIIIKLIQNRYYFVVFCLFNIMRLKVKRENNKFISI